MWHRRSPVRIPALPLWQSLDLSWGIFFLRVTPKFIYKFHALCNPSQGRMDIWGLRIEKWSSFSIPGVESLWYCFRPRDGKVFPTPGVGKVIPHQGLEKWFHPLRQSSVHRDTNSHFRGPKITGLETKGNGVSMKEKILK